MYFFSGNFVKKIISYIQTFREIILFYNYFTELFFKSEYVINFNLKYLIVCEHLMTVLINRYIIKLKTLEIY